MRHYDEAIVCYDEAIALARDLGHRSVGAAGAAVGGPAGAARPAGSALICGLALRMGGGRGGHRPLLHGGRGVRGRTPRRGGRRGV
ncbi:hypothetical protein [Kitasatospora sp. MAP5-34]|uniref:hypothetical protein n=1 Tax=Kitasatospora sp. MAP5-34 TaxID=3035102 RepID=UPI0024742685|nr:hypothetical protein [Kitasatospora sp. MAP5-34]